MAKEAKPIPVIGSLIMSGHCSFPVTDDPFQSHERCARNGGGSRANPLKVFTPCPCPCHYGEEFECGGCGRPIREALCWPLDEDGDMRYTHIDKDGRASGEDCSGPHPSGVSRNVEVEEDEEDYEPDELDQQREDAAELQAEMAEAEEEPEDEWDDLISEFDLDDD